MGSKGLTGLSNRVARLLCRWVYLTDCVQDHAIKDAEEKMTPALVMFITLFGAATAGSIVSTLITFAMVGEINRKNDNTFQVSYFNSSWIRVFRAYRALYPQGIYARAQVIVFAVSLVCFLIAFFLLFVVLPQRDHPSRRSGAHLGTYSDAVRVVRYSPNRREVEEPIALQNRYHRKAGL